MRTLGTLLNVCICLKAGSRIGRHITCHIHVRDSVLEEEAWFLLSQWQHNRSIGKTNREVSWWGLEACLYSWAAQTTDIIAWPFPLFVCLCHTAMGVPSIQHDVDRRHSPDTVRYTAYSVSVSFSVEIGLCVSHDTLVHNCGLGHDLRGLWPRFLITFNPPFTTPSVSNIET